MPFELRLPGRPAERFDAAASAEARLRALLQAEPDLEAAIIDLATGRPYAPAGDAAERDRLANEIGY